MLKYSGFAASEVIYNEDGSVGGVLTGDMGVVKTANLKTATCQVWNYALNTQCLQKAVAVT